MVFCYYLLYIINHAKEKSEYPLRGRCGNRSGFVNAVANLNNLKKHLFFEFLNLTDRVFILVRYSENVILGKRGFTAEEKENGIILVLNSKMNFLWDDYGITVTLVFGTSPQRCFIPVDDITAIYSPEHNAQFTVSPQPVKARENPKDEEQKPVEAEATPGSPENVISVDFTKKNRK